jgi:translation elongation factor EF-G
MNQISSSNIRNFAILGHAELYHYATIVRSLTCGRGLHSESFSHYEKMPKESEQKVIKERKELEDG